MSGGITFRQAIDNNKKKIIEYLTANGRKYTRDICDYYNGEREMPAIRKALNELRKEGKVSTDDKVRMWRGKLWWISEIDKQ
jgi:hypothetical protein